MLHYNSRRFRLVRVGRSAVRAPRDRTRRARERSSPNAPRSSKGFPLHDPHRSDILESNGILDGHVAGLARVMDAGVPVKKAAFAGIGWVSSRRDKIAVLSDILGNEDHLGGTWTSKVAGTKDGIPASRWAIKIQGISFEIFEKALAQCEVGPRAHARYHGEAIARPKPEPLATPAIDTIKITSDRSVRYRTGGTMIPPDRERIRGAEITSRHDGTVTIASISAEGRPRPVDHQQDRRSPRWAKLYRARVTRTMDFGRSWNSFPAKKASCTISPTSAPQPKRQKVTESSCRRISLTWCS